MVNRIKAMLGAASAGRGRQTSEHEFYDQYEASRYRSEAEARGHWNPPVETRCSEGGVHRVGQDQGRVWAAVASASSSDCRARVL